MASRSKFHGTKVELNTGDLIQPGQRANFGKLDRSTTHVYLTGTLDAATWGAELALGDGRGRIYIVEPTGSIEDDPNLTNKRFPGNPTKSYRSRNPFRIIGEVTDWKGHSPEQLKEMHDHRLSARRGEGNTFTVDCVERKRRLLGLWRRRKRSVSRASATAPNANRVG